MKHSLICLLLLALFQVFALAGEPPSIGGRWLLTMPRGFEYDATLEPVEPGLYRLRCGALNLQGLYELKGKRLVLANSTQPRMTGLVWEVKNRNVLLLTEHPEKSRFGSDYRNATLSRPGRAGQVKPGKGP